MRFTKAIFTLLLFISLITLAHADVSYYHRHLTLQEIERVRVLKSQLGGVDKKSVQETIHELESAKHPQINLLMQEAMAKTYKDIVRDINVEGSKKQEWLYSMICLNMAYLQFGGSPQGKYGSTTELNRLIRRKLTGYLPPNALKQPGFVYSLD